MHDIFIEAGQRAATDGAESMVPLELFPFRYRDPRTGMWVRARWEATAKEIAARGGRDHWTRQGLHRLLRQPRLSALPADDTPSSCERWSRSRTCSPAIDACERFLALLFLRRYVAWCALAVLYRRLA
jgi:hypothetical protein